MKKITLILLTGSMMIAGYNSMYAQKGLQVSTAANDAATTDISDEARAKMDYLAGYNSLVHREFKTLFTGKNFRLMNIMMSDMMTGMTNQVRIIEFSEDLKKWYPADLSREEIQIMSKALSMVPELKEKFKGQAEQELSYGTRNGFKIGTVFSGGVWTEFVEISKNNNTIRLKLQNGNIQELAAVSLKASDY